jgi:peptidoglycan/xylan/chitin deacetylase (PgdA/CDA1 family)
MRRAAAFLALLLASLTTLAQTQGAARTRFYTIALHDVVDTIGEEDDGIVATEDDTITTDKLVALLELIRASGMHVLNLDDIDAAKRGIRPLPERAILLTIDDGYRSLYTRVYPLLLAYRMPIVASLVGEWMDTPADGMVRYGDTSVPRSRFITWAQAREMADSGLVEFASHSYSLHKGVRANPQGGERPATVGPIYDAATGYATHAQYRARLADDLERSRATMREHLGRVPRALAWPYGRYRGAALEIAREAGFDFAFTLEAEPADLARPFAIARFPPKGNPTLEDMIPAIRTYGVPRPVQTMVCVDPARLAGEELEARLGTTIERVRKLGANAVAIDPFVRDAQGELVGAWFPNAQLPLRADVLSRIAWQLQTRAGVRVFVRIPRPFGTAMPPNFERLAQDLADAVQVDGVLFEVAPAFEVDPAAFAEPPWQIRERRARVDAARLSPAQAQVMSLFRAMERQYPGTRLALVSPGATAPMAIADLTFVEVRPGERPKVLEGSRRFGPWITSPDAPPDAEAIRAIARAFKAEGSLAAGWCPDDPLSDRPRAEVVAPETSAARRPE